MVGPASENFSMTKFQLPGAPYPLMVCVSGLGPLDYVYSLSFQLLVRRLLRSRFAELFDPM
jgi:hypothetical protein